jgi:hypothetical protein
MYASLSGGCNLSERSWISLEGNNTIQMPSVGFASQGANWTYPFPFFPVYAKNQTISGSILCKAELAGREARVSISTFSMQNLLSALQALDNETATVDSGLPIKLNGTGDARFAIQGVPSGLYTIMVADAQLHDGAATLALVLKVIAAISSGLRREISCNLGSRLRR